MVDFDLALIQRYKNLFLNYNRLRSQYVYDLSAEKASVAFEIIPVLLSLNEVDLPGYVSGSNSGFGVHGVGSSYHLRRVINDYFPETKRRDIHYQKYLIKLPLVESLFTVGSIGTVGQTYKSDFDYWVCIDKSKASDKAIDDLYEKTQQLSHWCQGTFGMEVHFFILDLKQAQMNDFGQVDEESSGSSQKKFLKEECYRTMLLVSGKIPFWWMLPPGSNESDYEQCWKWLRKAAPFDFVDFVDLGFLGSVSKNEFLGNALWQLGKGIKDPFKALLKMAMMDVCLSDEYSGPLLCDVLKKQVLEGSRFLRDMDPYLIVVETVLDFYKQQERVNHMNLLRRAFYLKSDPKMTRTRIKTSGGDYKIEVFKELMDSWDWALDLVEDMNQIENWSYGRQLKFATEINRFFFTTYRNLSETLRTTETQAIDQYDLTLLGRKLIALFARKRYKLRLTPILTGKRLILKRCMFQYDRPKSGKKKWVLFDSSRYPAERKKKDWRVYESESIVKSAAWLVNNGLYEFPITAVEMKPNPSGVMLNDLIHLLKHLQIFLQPASLHFSDGLHTEEEAVKEKIMAVIDMEEITKFQKPKTIDVVYRNTWGEMFAETYPYQDGLRVLKKHVYDLEVGGSEEIFSKFKVHIPESARETYFADQTYFHIMKELGLSDITIPSDQSAFARTKQDAILWTKANKSAKNRPLIQ